MTQKYRHHDNSKSTGLRRALKLVLCLIIALTAHTTYAQVIIGGDVYGGGKMGSVESSSSDATTVTINNGSVRTVFGGGQKGAVTGNTTVSVNGGTIGAEALEGTPYGGVYGGGEGAGATVTGSTNVTINGGDNFNNVYGGGKQALLTGNAHVTLIGGQVRNNVFAGACMANIKGYALVDIKGGSANQLLIKAVYGGNDISGSILNNIADNKPAGYNFRVTGGLPTKLESFVFAQATATNAFIGNVFGGGNGAYQYDGSEGNWSVTMKDLGEGTITFANLPNQPIAPHAYLQIEGGTYGSIYGGGNEATISERTDIYFGIGMNGENYADVTPMTNIPKDALSWLGLYEGYTMNEGDATFNMKYNAYRIFGGNNIADMAIRPTWHLKSGMVGNIYSGGNQGRMTYEKGLFLSLTSPHIKVNNVYGGCRMADVNPGGQNGVGTMEKETITYHRFKHADGDKFAESYEATYDFAEGYAARVLVLAGQINNLYGGNDISGKVYYGTNVELRGAISGDVYGGGNGSYAYTDNADWIKSNPQDADYYYSIPVGGNSLDALYAKRPHVEKTLLHITGIDAAAPPVYVTGGVYCGGNSATLDKDGDQSNVTAKFMIGQKVFINGVFLGSNGENMVSTDILEKYDNDNFSSLKLTDKGQFERYMKGVSVNLVPEIVWEWDDSDNLNKPGQTEAGGINSYIGAFYCGGNVGSMTTPYQMNMTFPRCLTIYDRIVGGCNSANISESNYNAALEGGVTSDFTNGTSKEDNKAKVVLNVHARLEPGKLTVTKDANGFLQEASYGLNIAQVKLENTYGEAVNGNVYVGANVYGGCYASGYINGGVEINVNSDLISPDVYTNANLATLRATADHVHTSTMSIYGGGYGSDAEIRGNTKINLTGNARVLKVFGGGEMGVVTGNAEVNLAKDLVTTIDGTASQNAYKVYAGGYAGPVEGNTTLNLLGGSVTSAFAGACNANIGGYAVAYVGCTDNYGKGLPYVSDAVYGGNDFGGQIIESNKYTVTDGAVSKTVRSQTYVQYISGKIGKALYGGSYGGYNYANEAIYAAGTYVAPKLATSIESQEGDTEDIILTNTFVDIASKSTSENDIVGSANSESQLTLIAGGGRGYKGLPEYVEVNQTYVLLHGAVTNRGDKLMAHRVYGGGNLSKVGNTRVDAYSGIYGRIFGGTHGVMTELAGDLNTSYDCGNTTINYYMENADMDVFGAGANSGASKATINLNKGRVNEVHGGAYTEGYTAETEINVPAGSTIYAHAIYGGGYGDTENRPCDVGTSNIIFASNNAKIENGIYGGNHNARATKQANVMISARVKDAYDALQNVFGAGYGVNTVTGFAHVQLLPGAEVANVYGGGRDGQVYNHYSYYDSNSIFGQYATNGKHATWTTPGDNYNTLIEISGPTENQAAAIVAENVYGAGLGSNSTTRGKVKVHLNGGTVKGDIYGGGYAGTVKPMDTKTIGYISGQLANQNIGTLCFINGGQTRNVFGGGYQGNITGNTQVTIGVTGSEDYYNGVPAILRSAYGGGEKAEVSGTSTVDMYNGYVGYAYVDGKYQPVLNLKEGEQDGLLKENGNLYGAGYGEGALVMKTCVNLHGGIIRNGLYGGGEIAAVGRGTRQDDNSYTISEAGQTNVYMYGGLVEGDVFGGGRGFSYDLTGNQIIGKRFYTDGYVFGKTNVEIYRGTVGTTASVAEGHGNVFGGGNIGYVYSAGVKYEGATNKAEAKINGHYYENNSYTKRTEDCRVHITAYSQVKAEAGVEIDDTLYQKGEYVPTRVLNKLNPNDTRWSKLDLDGLVIRNAVFAGGNVSSGSDLVYANAVTVYGNATAAVIDVFNRDLITLGGEHLGGLYGDGNLTFVDGYRELNITNYGSDYYRLASSVSSEQYKKLTPREQDYYSLDGDSHEWTISTTSGRKMNTIQRADFCGVFGSRILLHGAQDRVPDVVDYTYYTINRVKEVSLNCVKNTVPSNSPSVTLADEDTLDDDVSTEETLTEETHGNYFGIYNVVNFLGALTSDVEFNHDVRIADEDHYHLEGNTNYGTDTYFDFKNNNLDKEFRNCAKSANMVALASGVFLELVESKEGNEKVYGPVTGVIELDLINVEPGEGGGYVYAKNEHHAVGSVDEDAKQYLTLSDANRGAITQTAYTYTGGEMMIQTSGNFVHPNKRVVDDCFPHDEKLDKKYRAHYWYISGTSFIYDQHISAYTGAARSFGQSTNIPLIIPASGEGSIRIVDIKANKYFVGAEGVTSLRHGNKVYNLNDPITYSEWNQLPDGQGMRYKEYFTDTTYIAMYDCWTAENAYQAGDIISCKKYTALPNNVYGDEQKSMTIPKEEIFRICNEMSHDKGYMLTFEMTNPLIWGPYFTPENGKGKVLGDNLQDKSGYLQSPTMGCNESGIYGQRSYVENDVVSNSIVVEHKAIEKSTDSEVLAAFSRLNSQATFERAYVVVEDVEVDGNLIGEGNYISESAYEELLPKLSEQQKNAFDSAYICINTIEVAEKEFILNGDLISAAKRRELIAGTQVATNSYLAGKVIENYFSEAHVCTGAGNYGGKYFKKDQNYGALDVCALSEVERAKFNFNRDALDLFEKDFKAEVSAYHTPYNTEQLIDFTATYTGNRDAVLYKKVLNDGVYNGEVDTVSYDQGFVLTSAEYRQLVNEEWYYIPVELHENVNYIVFDPFVHNNQNFGYGQHVPGDVYKDLPQESQEHVVEYKNEKGLKSVYLCVEQYRSANIENSGSDTIRAGTIIEEEEYNNLPNSRNNFNIVGIATIETSTLYVPRESDIFNLSSDRIISVVLEYTYRESIVKKNTEKHVVNIKVEFKSGLPTVGDVTPPSTILPSTTVGLSVPVITPGAYEVIGGGWELYKTEADARAHKNGVPYLNNATPMYWYQNGYYVSYYAKTYLGKAYSNYVPFSVANYHRLGEVMNHEVEGRMEYMYIDHESLTGTKVAKIYLDAAEYDSLSTAAGKGKNDLDYFYELYEKTYDSNELDERVKGGANLVFILNSDINPTADSWTSIGTGEKCFAGTLHGNGYTIGKLNNSLFGNLCGKVYNLGVTGSFAGGGIADNGACPLNQHTSTTGYAENCWVYTTGTPAAGMKAIIGNNGQVVNSYYHTNNKYAEGDAIEKDDNAFRKGEVTYLLNGFHLYKRNHPEEEYNENGYVETYYANGDFVYANGEIPLTRDRRYDAVLNKYVPIYPDDYLFFGQRLTYDAKHDALPTRVEKVNGLIDRTEKGDRVYRAPAYYMSKALDEVYFNTAAVFTGPVHQGLTAIDFTEYSGNDTDIVKAADLSDFETLTSISFNDLTKNMLVYADNTYASYAVLDNYLAEPELDIQGEYSTVAPQSAESVHGHLVDFVSGGEGSGSYIATRDHFLVDKNNFNAPIAYNFDNGYHMWYQRTPDRFAESGSNGWDVVCLPFTAGLVTTHQKGEITHFYGDSTKMHEYWLREFMEVKEGENTKAVFARPAEDEKSSYEAENTFLYDYYYSKSNDKNADQYQDYYSKEEREYDNYAYLAAATPYIVAFPGKHYYEFDMSGEFEPQNTATPIAKLDKQIVTMVSTDNTAIEVTDDENLVKEVNGYQFAGTYQAKDVNGYLMNAEGNAFEAANSTTVPFRGYLIKSSENGAAPRRILISNAIQEEKQMEEVTDRGLTIYSKKGAIYVESTLEHEAVVVIYSLSGQVVNRIKVMPMSKEKVEVPSRGVYIANNRKIAVL